MKPGSLLSFNDDDFVDFEDLQLGPKIGEGQFSTVFVGRYFGETPAKGPPCCVGVGPCPNYLWPRLGPSSGDHVAIKRQTRNTKALERYLTRELGALKHLRHENLIEFLG